jgi:hypothetical protein
MNINVFIFKTGKINCLLLENTSDTVILDLFCSKKSFGLGMGFLSRKLPKYYVEILTIYSTKPKNTEEGFSKEWDNFLLKNQQINVRKENLSPEYQFFFSTLWKTGCPPTEEQKSILKKSIQTFLSQKSSSLPKFEIDLSGEQLEEKKLIDNKIQNCLLTFIESYWIKRNKPLFTLLKKLIKNKKKELNSVTTSQQLVDFKQNYLDFTNTITDLIPENVFKKLKKKSFQEKRKNKDLQLTTLEWNRIIPDSTDIFYTKFVTNLSFISRFQNRKYDQMRQSQVSISVFLILFGGLRLKGLYSFTKEDFLVIKKLKKINNISLNQKASFLFKKNLPYWEIFFNEKEFLASPIRVSIRPRMAYTKFCEMVNNYLFLLTDLLYEVKLTTHDLRRICFTDFIEQYSGELDDNFFAKAFGISVYSFRNYMNFKSPRPDDYLKNDTSLFSIPLDEDFT